MDIGFIRPIALVTGLPLALACGSAPAHSGKAALAQLPASDSADPTPAGQEERSVIAAINARDRITIPVHFGDSGPHPFLVDTGSETTVISTELADELGLVVSGSRRLAGSLERASVDQVGETRLSIGPHTLVSERTILLKGDDLGAAGVLGIESLRDFRVIFDFASDEIHITRKRRPERDWSRADDGESFEITVKAKRLADRMVLTSAHVDGVPVRVIIDTGSNASLGNDSLRKRLRKAEPLGYAMIHDVTGATAWREIIPVKTLTLGPLMISESRLIISNSPAFEELGLNDKPAVLLGMNHLRAFRRISVDFARREVSFDLKD